MEWYTLYFVISVFAASTGIDVEIERIESYTSRESCEAAGRIVVEQINTGENIAAGYFCAPDRKRVL